MFETQVEDDGGATSAVMIFITQDNHLRHIVTRTNIIMVMIKMMMMMMRVMKVIV